MTADRRASLEADLASIEHEAERLVTLAALVRRGLSDLVEVDSAAEALASAAFYAGAAAGEIAKAAAHVPSITVVAFVTGEGQ